MVDIMKKITDNKGLWGGRLIQFESLPSTNSWALENAADLQNGDIIWCMQQTSGRGRFQRIWHSPENSCLTFSVVITPQDNAPAAMSSAGPLAALAIRSYLEKQSINALLKWPNDVLANSKKISGLLSELSNTSGKLILGIGLNVNISEDELASLDLAYPTTSIKIETKRHYNIDSVLKDLLKDLSPALNPEQLAKTAFPSKEWCKYDALDKKNISVQTADSTIKGLYGGILENGQLRLIDQNKTEHLFWSGDVSIKKHQ